MLVTAYIWLLRHTGELILYLLTLTANILCRMPLLMKKCRYVSKVRTYLTNIFLIIVMLCIFVMDIKSDNFGNLPHLQGNIFCNKRPHHGRFKTISLKQFSIFMPNCIGLFFIALSALSISGLHIYFVRRKKCPLCEILKVDKTLTDQLRKVTKILDNT